MRVFFPAVLSLVVLSACAARERVDFLQDPAAGAELHTVHVATTRGPDPEQPVPGWSREEALQFGSYVVAVPPERRPGRISRPRGRQQLNPERHFTLTAQRELNAAGFRSTVAHELSTLPAREREAVIFVHGFNTTFIEGVYRVAQLGSDLALPGVALHYSWPSLGAPLAYAHDRDSVLFARDGLQQMISETSSAGAPRIVLVAHSMGAHLLMETLRQMAIAGDRNLSRIGGVILIAPDLDIDVFRSQARRIGPLPQPFVIVSSQRDRILQLSARLSGETARLGNLGDPTELAEFELTLIDVSAFSTRAGHFNIGNSPALIQMMTQLGVVDRALTADAAGVLPLLPATILTIQNATQVVLQPMTEGRQRRIVPPPRPRLPRPFG
ncbi:MAG: alpha/beta fold hydrolase [Pararhodobacter sp.]|nr:alpha/beta fold hydrolase [Pararhodobacter sp.]